MSRMASKLALIALLAALAGVLFYALRRNSAKPTGVSSAPDPQRG
jgi:cbb3-type cytochrome oxidase subunit 3